MVHPIKQSGNKHVARGCTMVHPYNERENAYFATPSYCGDIVLILIRSLSNHIFNVLVDGGDGADVEFVLKDFENVGGEEGG